jgi:hypothetical protein
VRTMYDAVDASRIPANAEMVAGYVDTIRIPQWTDADWARFPNAVKVEIVKKATSNKGHVLDVEVGDATPAEAPGWVRMRRNSGLATPTIYCSLSAWRTLLTEFASQGVPEPLWWIAHYDNNPLIPGGAIAIQHTTTPGYDISAVADYWPGVDPVESENDMMSEFALWTRSDGSEARYNLTIPAGRTAVVTITSSGVAHLRAFGWMEDGEGNGFQYSHDFTDRNAAVIKPPAGTTLLDIQFSGDVDASVDLNGVMVVS